MDKRCIENAQNDIIFEDRSTKTGDILYSDIVFFSLAEGGAMGCPGEVLIATKNKSGVKWYSMNTMNEEHEKLLRIFPPLETFDCGIFGKASGIQEGWNHVDLGFGNHLLVRDDYFEPFQDAVTELKPEHVGVIYSNWRGIAQLLLKNILTNLETFEWLRDILETIDSDEYPEIYEIISNHIDLDTESVFDSAFYIAQRMHEADGEKQLPESVAKFMCAVYEGEAKCGNADAACDIGSLYYTGRAGEQNYSKAVEFYTIAANGGCRQAQENLGYCYYYGRDVKVDYQKAFHYFALGAFDGHIRSLYKIGDMYRSGYYVEKNEKEAFYIYQRCAETMCAESVSLVGADVMMRMADCYFEGLGTERDYRKALDYYQKAEKLFYDRLMTGDFMIKGCYEKVIARQEEARENLMEELPGYDWVK